MEMQKKNIYIYTIKKYIYCIRNKACYESCDLHLMIGWFQQCWNSSCTIQKYDIKWNGIFLDTILVKWLHVYK